MFTTAEMTVPMGIIEIAAKDVYERRHPYEVPEVCAHCSECRREAATWFEPGLSIAGTPESYECRQFGGFTPWDKDCKHHDDLVDDYEVMERAADIWEYEIPDEEMERYL